MIEISPPRPRTQLITEVRKPVEADFRSALLRLWLRLIALGIIGLTVAEALMLAPVKVQVWSYFLKPTELVFEVVVRLIFAALAGLVLGSVCTAAVAPFFWFFKASRARLEEWATRVGVVLVVFLDSRLGLSTLIKWSHRGMGHERILLAAHFLVFAIALFIPRARKPVVHSLDDCLGEKMTRRMALATVAGAAGLAATEFAFGKATHTAKAALTPQRPKSNFLLITFDALSAEDMSLYGYRLPTTPHIDAFASKGTVFTNYYSASTFTTPCVATMLTGLYPSESHVHQLQGRLRAEHRLPQLMRAGGYATAAFFSNPWAYHLAEGIEDDYDFLPEAAFRRGGVEHLWNATGPLHQNSGIGSRVDEYFDLEAVWNSLARVPYSRSFRYSAAASFAQAQELLAKLPEGYFLWVHLLPPHNPYRPATPEQGRFLAYDEKRTLEDEREARWKHYPPEEQSQVDQWRLLYDEYILTADRAFGSFVSDLESAGKLRNTTVMVSADHGESFEGGVFRHESAYQTRPVIHVPLIIRTPGQTNGRKVAFTTDQTALAPTILELAGQLKPEQMRGQSLAGWLNRLAPGEGEGQAFSQYLERNSIFKALHHGTVGVVDGRSQSQYVLDLDTQKGSLRPLKEAQNWDLDRTAENPALAEVLRKAIYSRFPDLP